MEILNYEEVFNRSLNDNPVEIYKKEPLKSAVYFTIEEIKELLKFWQRLLRLQDWEVRFKIVGYMEMSETHGSSTVWGDINDDQLNKHAEIRIICPTDVGEPFTDTDVPHYDMEVILVHELLELYFHFVDRDNNSQDYKFKELAINKIADALVALRRQLEWSKHNDY